MNYPVIPAIRKFDDAKRALENIREWFKSLTEQTQAATGTTPATSLRYPGISLATADLVLSPSASYRFLEVTTGSSTYAILAPNTPGKEYVVINKDGSNPVKIKVGGGTGITIAISKRAIVYCNGTDYDRVTGDQ